VKNALTRAALFAAFVATVVGANWALNRYGIVTVVPATRWTPALSAPAGVYFAGLAFGLRDFLHDAGGRRWVLAAIAAGAAVSYVVEDAVTLPGGLVPIALASAAAFALSELADLAVYEPLRHRSWPGAVTASNIAGGVADSILFLWLAFGNAPAWTPEYRLVLGGLVVGKALMILPALLAVWGVRRAVPSYALDAAAP
jgi:uncharacterized PurR-regulated membrane protein YhhQ (DUF165 family)